MMLPEFSLGKRTTKTGGVLDARHEVETDQIEGDDCLHSGRTHRNAILRVRLSASNFLYRHDVLYGSILELRNCFHRIQSLWKRGYMRGAQIGPVYQTLADGFLVPNIRSQGRSLGIQKLRADSPWMTTEDCVIFLLGWDKAEEWRASDRCDTKDSTLDGQS